nr:sulfonate ABC transporter substrate-binding protein [Oceanobacillus sp. CFH 90083]
MIKLGLAVMVILLIAACGSADTQESEASEAEETVHIGHQKFGTLNLLKAEGTLEERLAERDMEVEWVEFPAGPQLLEALNGGSVDFGHTGEAPPIFSQAAGAPLVYIANGESSPKSEAIVVQEDSPIKEVSELEGKKVALNRGSNVHYLLVKALEEAGLSINDIEPVYLAPAEARTAFDRGDVDAWAIWDPFLQSAEDDLNAQIIRDAQGIADNREFLLAERSFAENQPEIMDIILEELEEVEQDVKENPEEYAEFLSPQVGLDTETLTKVLKRRELGLHRIEQNVLDDQQNIADTFYNLDLIPEELSIQEASLEEEE